MKLIWLSDLHLVRAGGLIYGRDPTKQLQRAIDRINEHHTDASYCILSGDLVNDGDAEIYAVSYTHLTLPTIYSV